MAARLCLCLVFALATIAAFGLLPNAPGNGPQRLSKEQKSATAFSASDATRLLGELQQAIEGNDRRRFLKQFDASRMPNYATFRDQVAEFFEKYESGRMRYHITQTSSDGEVGIVLAELELEMTPAKAAIPVRKNAQLRLATVWDGKQWKIVDWAPWSVLN